MGRVGRVGLVVAVVLALGAPTLVGALAHAEGKEGIEVFVIDPRKAKRPENACTIEACTSLVKLIDGAKVSIDFAIYGMRNQAEVLRALRDAKLRGVAIRGTVDRDGKGQNYYSSTEAMVAALGGIKSDYEVEKQMAQEAEEEERGGGSFVQPCERPAGFAGPLQCLGYDMGERCLMAAHASSDDIESEGAIMHNKFFVIDGEVVWTGSTNLSDSGTGGYNANMVAVVRSKQIAQWYTREFNQMYQDGKYHNIKRSFGAMKTTLADADKTEIEILFSPQDKPITNAVRPLLQRARKTIDVGIFYLTHKEITRDLIAAHNRGVKVRVIVDATSALNGYTKHELLRVAGIPVKVETWGGKMHMKSAVIDGEVLIAGSMNWTSAGEGGNDENTLIIRNGKIAKGWVKSFDALWKDIPDKWLQGRPGPESRDSTTACTDGVDNNFDHKADDQDPGCSATPPALPPLPPHEIVPKEDGHRLVKVLGSADPDQRYYPWGHPEYDEIIADQYFCSEADAQRAGFKSARRGRRR